MAYAVWHEKKGLWLMAYVLCLVAGLWHIGRPMPYASWPAYGLWPLAYGPWPLAYGLRPMAYGLWPTAYGLRPMAYGLLPTAYCLRPYGGPMAYALWRAYGLCLMASLWPMPYGGPMACGLWPVACGLWPAACGLWPVAWLIEQ